MPQPTVRSAEPYPRATPDPAWAYPRCGGTDLYAFYRMAVTAPLEPSGHRPWPRFGATPTPALSLPFTEMTFGCDTCGASDIAPQRLTAADATPTPADLLSWG